MSPAGLKLYYPSILLGSFKQPVSRWVILYTTCVTFGTRILREILVYMTSCGDLQRCQILSHSYSVIIYFHNVQKMNFFKAVNLFR